MHTVGPTPCPEPEEAALGAAPGRPTLLRSLLVAGGGNVLVLAVNLVTGVLVARLLGPSARGEVAVVLALTQIAGWLGALGMNEGLTFVAARSAAVSGRLVGTALALSAAAGALGVLLAQLLLPVVLAGQSDDLLALGRVYAPSVAVGVAGGFLLGVLAGAQDFVVLTAVRVAQPVSYLVLLLVLAAVGGLTTADVLAATAGSVVVVLLSVLWRVRGLSGIGRPSGTLARQAAAYGLKVQGSMIGGLANARLDLLVMPAVLTTAAIGLYSVATNVAFMVVALVGAVSVVVFPAATHRGQQAGAVLVTRVLRLVLLAGLLVVLPLGLAAPVLLSVVYGSDFAAATDPLRLLLPGMILVLGTEVVDSGLQAAGRPLAASAGQLLGLGVTVVGLLLTLEPYGAEGAAATTTCAYLATFAFGAWQLRRGGAFKLRQVADVRALWADLDGIRRRVVRSGPDS
jgi:O-antigen/teichoic acid export membrane protein